MANDEDRRGPGFWKFTAWITNPKTGEKTWARDCGKRAFCIWIPLRKA